LLEVRPNNLSVSGRTFYLLEMPSGYAALHLQGDQRYLLLFVLSLAPLLIAFSQNQFARGWQLVGIGNLLIILSLLLPAIAAQKIMTAFQDLTLVVEYFGLNEQQAQFTNLRVVPSGAIATGITGGILILLAGLRDLRDTHHQSLVIRGAASIGALIVLWLFWIGELDPYSVVQEYYTRGSLLEERFIEHVLLVLIALGAGLFLGIGQGVWAARDERIAPVILYTVSIIQTIPSLALFGLLLVPLSDLGKTSFEQMFIIFCITIVIAISLIIVLKKIHQRKIKRGLVFVAALFLAIPLSLFTIISVSFTYRIGFISLTDASFTRRVQEVILVTILAIGTWIYARYGVKREKNRLRLRYIRWGLYGLSLILLGRIVFLAGEQQLVNVQHWDDLTIGDFGTSGIGVAPALIALTLYSLLPVVRNTYVGLKNVDASVVDAGRGMGMNSTQIFFMIELPLAFPVIMAGVRNAAVTLVGLGTIAAAIGGGGLGQFILQGIKNVSLDQILLGTIPAVILASVLDGGLRGLEMVIVSPGIRKQNTP
jgi:ABC-type proline/glycine betaine transport system permease subunit